MHCLHLKVGAHPAGLWKASHRHCRKPARIKHEDVHDMSTLFRFLMRPTPEVEAEVSAFSKRHFYRPYEQRTGPLAGMPRILGVHARVQDTTQARAHIRS